MEIRHVNVRIDLYFLGDPESKPTVITCRWHEAALLVADWIRQTIAEEKWGAAKRWDERRASETGRPFTHSPRHPVACLSEAAFTAYTNEGLTAPHLLWSEATSVLHELRWRQEISADLAAIALDRLHSAPISPRRPKGLLDEAWRIADLLGWGKTYDAEYVALARLLRCRLPTTDAKLKRGASRLAEIVGPTELY